MKTSRILTLAVAVVLAGHLGVTAQEEPAPVQPRPEHKMLAKFAGNWNAKVESMGQTMPGKATYTVELGGLWLVEKFEMDFMGQKFSGKGMTTYDPVKKQYVNVWFDSMSASPMTTHGKIKDNTWTQTGMMTGPDGKKAKVKLVTKFVNDDKKVMEMFGPGPDGKMAQMMKITYTRKK